MPLRRQELQVSQGSSRDWKETGRKAEMKGVCLQESVCGSLSAAVGGGERLDACTASVT